MCERGGDRLRGSGNGWGDTRDDCQRDAGRQRALAAKALRPHVVRSRFGDPTPERGGRAKRYFTLTTRGGQALARAQQSYQRLLEGVTLPRVARA
jgi:hypothetical protein